MAVVRPGSQYRQDPRVRGADLSADRAKKNEKLPSARETGLSVETWTGKALPIIGFSTVSLGGSRENVRFRQLILYKMSYIIPA